MLASMPSVASAAKGVVKIPSAERLLLDRQAFSDDWAQWLVLPVDQQLVTLAGRYVETFALGADLQNLLPAADRSPGRLDGSITTLLNLDPAVRATDQARIRRFRYEPCIRLFEDDGASARSA